jgi:hypothetical protein
LGIELGERFMTEEQQSSWRDGLKIHPAADLFPMMGEIELNDLAKDIET